MRKSKRVVMSNKEVTLIILTIVGALSLYAWQTYRMAQHMGASRVEQGVPMETTQKR